MKLFYVIVHCSNDLTEGVFLPAENPIRRELTRILKEEEFVHVRGDENRVPPSLPKDKPIRVCGQMWNLCVQRQHKALLNAGYNSTAYREASLDSSDIPDW